MISPSDPRNPERIAENTRRYESVLRDHRPDSSTQLRAAFLESMEGRAPDVNDYVPDWAPTKATWFQVYETVSEGTPVSPPFATREELVEYLVKNGDFWAQYRGEGGYSRKAAEAFVKDEWAPSLVVQNGIVQSGIEADVKADLAEWRRLIGNAERK